MDPTGGLAVENKPRVVHVREKHDVYIGRPSKWGNPFPLNGEQNRSKVIAQYRNYLFTMRPDLIEDAKKELRGKVLGCFCAPKPCHGDILLEVANNGDSICRQQAKDSEGHSKDHPAGE
jgi:hypothetical protein